MLSTAVDPRRLTQLFADTKKSYEHVVQAQRNVPEAASLHLKLRIQKDRLIAWGIQWSDRSTASQAGDIDGSLDRAGISDLVASIIGSIRELLDEAESLAPIQSIELSPSFSELKGFGKSLQEPVWTTSSLKRLEEILKDLTTSIDTLCDLSRPRVEHSTTSSNAPDSIFERFSEGRPPSTTPSSVSVPMSSFKRLELDHIAPNRLRLRQSSTLPGSAPPSYESVATGCEERAFAFLSSRRDSNPGRKSSIKHGETPVLLDFGERYASSDASYIKPDPDRYEELSSTLEWIFQESATSYQGFLRLEGWTVDTANPRCAYVYEVPLMHRSLKPDDIHLQPRSLLSFLQNGGDTDSTNVPSLENRFRLAHNIASSLMLLHGKGVSHRNISSNNVIFFVGGNFLSPSDKIWKGPVLRLPYLTAFHQRSSIDQDCSDDPIFTGIYQHPNLGEGQRTKYTLAHDLYSLGLILLEIGLWMPIGKFWKAKYTRRDFKARLQEIYLRKLSGKCGEGYMNVVLHCMTAAENSTYPSPSQTPPVTGSGPAGSFSVVGPLQRCCLIDSTEPVDQPTSIPNGPVPVLEEQRHQAQTITYSPDGGISASAHNDTKIRLMEMDTGKLRSFLDGHCGLVLALAFSADGRSLASGSEDCTICLWDTATWTLRTTLVSHSGAVTSVAFSPDCSILASGSNDYTVRLWDVATGILNITLESDANPIKAVEFSFDGKILTSHSLDHTVRLWNVATGALYSAFKSYSTSAPSEGSLAITTSARSDFRSITATELVSTQQFVLPKKDDLKEVAPDDPGSISKPRAQQSDAIETQENGEKKKTCTTIKVWSHELPSLYTNYWNSTMFPKLSHILARAISRWESYTIDLFMAGAEADIARPTVYMECTSTTKVRKILRHLNKELRLFDIKVVSGQIIRSKGGKKKSHKTAAKKKNVSGSKPKTGDFASEVQNQNPLYQEVPTCGASIGAYHDGNHLPPVSFGGAVLIDGQTYGMSVHHMLEEDDEIALGLDDGDCFSRSLASRSAANDGHTADSGKVGEMHIDHQGLYPFEVSESAELPDSPSVQGDAFSDYSSNLDSQDQFSPQVLYPFEISEDDCDENMDPLDDDEFWLSPDFDREFASMTAQKEDDDTELGDTIGVKAGCGEHLIVTQPARDDVQDGFFPSEEDANDEHLFSHTLGHIHASSGIKRSRRDQIIHEIDWALIKINEQRSRFHNIIQGGGKYCKVSKDCNFLPEDTLPLKVMSVNELGGLQVHAFGRTSGLQTGVILPAMRTVKMPGRSYPSHSWQVRGNFGGTSPNSIFFSSHLQTISLNSLAEILLAFCYAQPL
jgi:hypothetical protein